MSCLIGKLKKVGPDWLAYDNKMFMKIALKLNHDFLEHCGFIFPWQPSVCKCECQHVSVQGMARVGKDTYTHWNPHTCAQPMCGTVQNFTQIHSHSPPGSLTSKVASNRNPTDTDELRASLLGDDRSFSQPSSTRLALDPQSWLTHHFLRIPFPSIHFLCGHRCLRSYTLWAGTDGSYSSPSIRALSGEHGDHNPLDCILLCVFPDRWIDR